MTAISWPETTARFLRQRAIRLKQERMIAWRHAARDAQAIIAMIAREFNPRRVYQWGSLLDPDRFQLYSDIDLAVEGLGGAPQYFRLLDQAGKMTPFPLDLVELEKIADVHRESIIQRGKLVYERTP